MKQITSSSMMKDNTWKSESLRIFQPLNEQKVFQFGQKVSMLA